MPFPLAGSLLRLILTYHTLVKVQVEEQSPSHFEHGVDFTPRPGSPAGRAAAAAGTEVDSGRGRSGWGWEGRGWAGLGHAGV